MVGRVYSRIMKLDFRLLPCLLHVIGQLPFAMEVVALDKVHNDGKYLEIIDLVLRVIYNIKNYGESLA